MTTKLLKIAFLSILISLTGCSDDDGPSKDTGPKDTAAEGTKKDMTAGDTTTDADLGPQPEAGACSIEGRWKHESLDGFYTFRNDGTMRFEFPAFNFDFEGTYTLTGDRLEFSTKRADCNDVKAVYDITFGANCKSFKFATMVDDKCGNRSSGISGATFNLQP